MFPAVGEVVVTVMNVGPATFEKASASPSGSDPVMAWSAVAPSGTVMFATGFRVGARFTLIVSDFWSDTPDVVAVARTVPAKIPPSPNPGARWTLPVAVPLPEFTVVTVMNVGPATLLNTMGLPEGLLAVKV